MSDCLEARTTLLKPFSILLANFATALELRRYGLSFYGIKKTEIDAKSGECCASFAGK